MARVVWSPQARDDLREITLFIKRDSKTIAEAVSKRIVGATRRLAEFPASGREVPEFADETFRELIVYSYRVIYHVERSEVHILSVVHGARTVTRRTIQR